MLSIIGFIRYVYRNCFLAKRLKAMIDAWRYAHKNRGFQAYHKLLQLAFCGRAIAVVKKHEPHNALYACKIVCLNFMQVPCLYPARIGCCYVCLAKCREYLIVATQYLHEPAALVFIKI